MEHDKSTTTSKLAYAVHLINGLPAILLSHVDELAAIQQRLERLDGKTCTGHAHWRDKNAPGKTRKLYILHGIDQACPTHGKPKPNTRTRVYVGNKPDRISEALAAIEREEERLELQQDLNRLMGKVNRVIWDVRSLYRTLDHLPPTLEEDLATITAPSVLMATG